ncbi:MAG: non-canonical purine NTP pyrophosphatase, RdgB/HAM1 family [Ignavibacteria bacterium GWB2_35_6b]|nr:MAG: non-canonical purine NTP pyrophosphatase, RdgB/HAM1 family [Ignavibacteria bacterium GWB2_35_6b]
MDKLKEIIFATGNKGKLAEVKKIFEGTEIDIISLYDLGEVPEIIEDGDTFEANSFIKAKAIFDSQKKPVIADDSGLEIEQLENRPGVYAARYAGENCTYEDNNIKVINELKDFPEPHRARFVCCAVYYDGQNKEVSFGYLRGKIIKEFRGQNGFGYDPIFIPDGFDKTLSEMNIEEKNKMSHRAEAFNDLRNKLQVRF